MSYALFCGHMVHGSSATQGIVKNRNVNDKQYVPPLKSNRTRNNQAHTFLENLPLARAPASGGLGAPLVPRSDLPEMKVERLSKSSSLAMKAGMIMVEMRKEVWIIAALVALGELSPHRCAQEHAMTTAFYAYYYSMSLNLLRICVRYILAFCTL